MMAPASKDTPFPDPKERTPAILLVEDEVLIRFAISDFLQECGFRVHVAANAEEAIRILGAEEDIDLVFSDVNVPGSTMSGFDLALWMRKNCPGLPIVLTSGDSRMIAAAEEFCKNEPFFAKPYDLAQVVAHMRTLIGAKARKSD